ncbi:MAG: hypothetical protein WCS62_06155 [Bacilli bacterium]
MKYTRKLQFGGPLVAYQPSIQSTPATPTAPSGAVGTTGSAGTAKKSASLLDDNDLLEELMDAGLNNETEVLIQQLMEIEQQSDNPFLQATNRRSSLALIGQINKLKMNKKL